MSERAQHLHLLLDERRIEPVFRQPRIARHDGFRHHVARIDQVHAMPVIRVAPADAVQVRAGALAAPLERPVVDELAGHRVMAVALGLGAERPDHLRMADTARLADVEVAALRAAMPCAASGRPPVASSTSGKTAARSRPGRRPPTTSTVRTMSRPTFFRLFRGRSPWRSPQCAAGAGMGAARLRAPDGAPDVVGHDQHAHEVEHAAEETHDVERMHCLHRSPRNCRSACRRR